jgi:hypothetical protein
MQRRKFLSIASFAGVSVASFDALGGLARPGARAVVTPGRGAYRGPLFITIHAAGGWDPTSLCDPKGSASDTDLDANNWSYRARDIGTTRGGLRYAPLGTAERPAYFREFFEKHERRLLVINGVDVASRGHDTGARHLWSGRQEEGYPSFAALVAGIHARDLPMSYLSFGGYDEPVGEVEVTRGTVHAGPRVENYDRPDDAIQFDPQAAGNRAGADEAAQLQRWLPKLDEGNNPLIRQIQVAMAAYRAGLTAAVNLELAGFDTHGDHDAGQIPLLAQILEALDFIVEEAKRQGIADDYVAVVGSEFGRAPGYNADNGKDHWPVTSVLAMGKGIRGGRVVGATTDRLAARPVDPRTLQPSDRGVRIEPKHIQQNLRRLAGIDGDYTQLYPLEIADGEDIDLFS